MGFGEGNADILVRWVHSPAEAVNDRLGTSWLSVYTQMIDSQPSRIDLTVRESE